MTKLTTPQRLTLLVAASGGVMARDPLVPTGIYRSLVHPHGYLKAVGEGYVITKEGREAVRTRSTPKTLLDAAE